MSIEYSFSPFNETYFFYSACSFSEGIASPMSASPVFFAVSTLPPIAFRNQEEIDTPSFDKRFEPSIILQSSALPLSETAF